jgi:ribonucleoside-diphosphate reductase alpha chain
MFTKLMSREEAYAEALKFYDGDALQAGVFIDKYALRDKEGNFYEGTYTDLAKRMAEEFHRIELNYANPLPYEDIYNLLTSGKGFVSAEVADTLKSGVICPQGSPMFGVGNTFQAVSTSNCAVIASPLDTMSGIMNTARDMANLYKRRFGVGVDISTLRPDGAKVNNAAHTSTGAWSFADFYSYVTRMVGQSGRRGALMISIDVRHPDVEQFITMKADLTKVTGANVSVRVTNAFMEAVEQDAEFTLQFPVDVPVEEAKFTRVVKARQIFRLIAEQACKTAEPGVLFWDEITGTQALHLYKEHGFEVLSTNPCFPADQRIATSEGLLTFGELYDSQANFLATVENRALLAHQGIVGTEVGAVSAFAATPVFRTRRSQVLRVGLKDGRILRLTPDHKVLTTEGYVEAKDLTVLHEVVLQSAEGQWGNSVAIPDNALGFASKNWQGRADRSEKYNPPNQWNADLGFLCGLLAGDGFISNDGTVGWTFSKSKKADLIEIVGSKMSAWFGSERAFPAFGDRVNMHYRSVPARFFTALGAGNATVPEAIWSAPREVVVAYLAGVYAADGAVNASEKSGSCDIRLSSSKVDFLRQIQLLLGNFGIHAKLYLRREAGTKMMPDGKSGMKEYDIKAQYELILSSVSRERFVEAGMLTLPHHVAKYSEWAADRRLSTTTDFTSPVILVEEDGEEEVYCTTVHGPHAIVVQNVSTAQCGEIPLPDADSCRLISIYLPAFVELAFTDEAVWDQGALFRVAYIAQRLMDDLIDLEIEKLTEIRDLADTEDERQLFERFIDKCVKGRRTGLGTHGLGDMLARLCVRYGSDEALSVVEAVYATISNAAYQASVDMAEQRGAFPIWNWETEKDTTFFSVLPVDLVQRMARVGRRNGVLLTNAPTGTRSLLSENCSSGIEPVFSNFYTRRRKIDAARDDMTPDYVDALGDGWKEFKVFHPNVKKFLELAYQDPEAYGIENWLSVEHLPFDEFCNKAVLPYYFVTANDLNWHQRVRMQGTIQRYIDHSISSTTNLPRGTTPDVVANIYLEAWKAGCKGITVYVDGSRDAQVLTSESPQPEKTPDVETVSHCQGTCDNSGLPLSAESGNNTKRGVTTSGTMTKASFVSPIDGAERKVYVYVGQNEVQQPVEVFVADERGDEDFHPYAAAVGRLASLCLKHGVSAGEVAHSLTGLKGGSMSFRPGGMATSVPDLVAQLLREATGERVNKALQPQTEEPVALVPKTGDATTLKKCPQCGEVALKVEGGCSLCTACGSSRCS